MAAKLAGGYHGLPRQSSLWVTVWFHAGTHSSQLPYNALVSAQARTGLLSLGEWSRYGGAVLLLLLGLLLLGRIVPPTRGRWFTSFLAAWGVALGTGVLALAGSAVLLAYGGHTGQTLTALADQIGVGSPVAAVLALVAAVVFAVLGRLFALSSEPEEYVAPDPDPEEGVGYHPRQARWIAWVGALVALACLAAGNQTVERKLPDSSWAPLVQHVAFPGTWTWHLSGASWRDWVSLALWLLVQSALVWILLRLLATRQVRRGAWRACYLAVAAVLVANLVVAVLTALAQSTKQPATALPAAAGSAIPATVVLGVVTGLAVAVTARAVRYPEAGDDDEDLTPLREDPAPTTDDPFSETVRFARPRNLPPRQ
ncbi:hypothetical protein [Phaeacidiphilus oryzae]|uniref:hypothetical protein n=1 Tax=Phaeacidiphilus oryzae TaxID=348818 RepID=UPI00055B8131|nr:hypothetical protein [Phaeacidiphilus oryzae]